MGKRRNRNRAVELIIECSSVQCPFHFESSHCDARLCIGDLDVHMERAYTAHMELVHVAQDETVVPIVRMLSEGLTEGVKVAGARALEHFAISREKIVAVVEAGVVPPLIALLRDGLTHNAKVHAASALCNLTRCAETRVALVDAGVVCPLVELLGRRGVCGSDAAMVVLLAARTLQNLTICPSNRMVVADAGGVLPLVRLMRICSTLGVKVRAACVLANLSICAECRISIMTSGSVPTFVALLLLCGSRKTYEAKLGALASARALKNLAIYPCNREAIIRAGAVVPLARMVALRSTGGCAYAVNAFLGARAAARALKTLAISSDHRASMVQAGAVVPLLAFINGVGGDVSMKNVALVLLDVLVH
jgi:hypothetical protein